MDLERIVEIVNQYQPVTVPNTAHSAAVMLLLMHDDAGNISLIVTKRSETVATYVGDYCFPGGMREITDNDLLLTAQREIEEELGLLPAHYQVIGQLDDFYDHYLSQVRPFVATIRSEIFNQQYHSSVDEIAGIFYFPLQDLPLLSRDVKLEQLSKRHPTYSYHQGKVMIWGLTASIMVLLGNILFGLARPIAKQRDP
jgi:8-oxo-dGTP pyrophosphatase MutT (NUDIX family)